MGEETPPNAEAKTFESDKAIAAYLDDAFRIGDAGAVAHALGVVARAKGMAAVAEQAGLPCEQLEKSLRPDGDLTISTMLAILPVLGVKWIVQHDGAPWAFLH